MVGIALKMVGHPQDAEDAVQESFLKAYRAREQLRDGRALAGWLKQILVRHCMDRPSRRGEIGLEAVEAFLPDAAAPSADRTAAAREEVRRTLSALLTLPANQRACLVLTVFEGMSGKETAEALGLRYDSVRQYVHQARERLAKDLKIFHQEVER